MSQSGSGGGGGGGIGNAGKWIGALVGGVIAVGAVAYTVLTGSGAATTTAPVTDDLKQPPAKAPPKDSKQQPNTTTATDTSQLPRAMPVNASAANANAAINTDGSSASAAAEAAPAAAANKRRPSLQHRPSLVGIKSTDPLYPVLTRLYATVTSTGSSPGSRGSGSDAKSAPAPPGGAKSSPATATRKQSPALPVPKWVPPGYVSPNASLVHAKSSAALTAAFDAVAGPIVYTALYRYLRVPELAVLRGVNRAWRSFADGILYQPLASNGDPNPYLHHHAASYGFGELSNELKAQAAGSSSSSGGSATAISSGKAAALAQAAERRRGGVWRVVSGAERTLRTVRAAEREQQVPSLYRELLARKGKSFYDVQKDCVRTLIHHSSFSDETAAERALQNVLNAYSIHDVQVGYCQGMNFLAAFVLTKLNAEEEAYWTWYTIMQSPRYQFRTFYFPDLQGLHLCKYQFRYLFEGFLPTLYSHFLANDVPADALTEWWMTLFTFRAFPRATASRIWDLMLVDGPVTLYRVALAVLSLAQERLLAADFEVIFEWTKQVPNSTELLHPDAVVSHALSFEVTNDLLAQLTAQYWNQFAD